MKGQAKKLGLALPAPVFYWKIVNSGKITKVAIRETLPL